MTETLMVRCPHCRRQFAAALQVDRASLEAMVVREVYECPHCRMAATYTKADHFHLLVTTVVTGRRVG